MPTFLKKTSVKVIGSILCALCLAVGIFFGLISLNIALSGGFSSQTELYNSMIEGRLNQDADLIMNCYFDPSDPSHPWVSYYTGPIYSGQNSNLLWTITDSATGDVVLSTYDGEDANAVLSQPCYYSTTQASPRDIYTVTSQLFYCDGQLYSYSEDDDSFSVLKTSATQEISGIEELDPLAKDLGFTYNGSHYNYQSDYGLFYWSDDTTEIYTSVDSNYVLTCYLLSALPYSDPYQKISHFCSALYPYRFLCCGLAIGFLLVGLFFLILLCCNVGHVNGSDTVILNPIHKIPGELALIPLIFAFLFGISLSDFGFVYSTMFLAALGAAAILLALVLTYLFPSLCARIKTHTLLSNTLCARLLRGLKRLWSKSRSAFVSVFLHLPLIWKVLGAYLLLCILELIGLSLFFWGNGMLYFFWVFEKLLVGGIIAYVCMSFLRLKSGAERIAAGDYNTKVSTDHLVLEFKTTAETLNHIQDGISTAVDRRMRSERLKTELITNVSHDLKTPLTSIVSYVDLLKQEPAGSPAAEEYLQVLDRQSARLKKLIEDLVEASKASTGNIAVHAEPLDFSMLLGQALGEYSERLEKAGLTPVSRLPDSPVMISADGRLLWRILDNLLGNAVKYAMPGTRLYVTLTADTHAIVTFRNISRDPLDVTPEELMERFVRGDSSRHTEGSGLGLSIAKSLAESMGGEFILSVDGDLFKAAVIFPVLPSPAPAPEPLDTPPSLEPST